MPEFDPITEGDGELYYDVLIRRLQPVLSRPDLYDLAVVVNEVNELAIRNKAENEE